MRSEIGQMPERELNLSRGASRFGVSDASLDLLPQNEYSPKIIYTSIVKIQVFTGSE